MARWSLIIAIRRIGFCKYNISIYCCVPSVGFFRTIFIRFFRIFIRSLFLCFQFGKEKISSLWIPMDLRTPMSSWNSYRIRITLRRKLRQSNHRWIPCGTRLLRCEYDFNFPISRYSDLWTYSRASCTCNDNFSDKTNNRSNNSLFSYWTTVFQSSNNTSIYVYEIRGKIRAAMLID